MNTKSLLVGVGLAAALPLAGAAPPTAPVPTEPAVLPALGAPSRPKVDIAWNRFQNVAEMNANLRRLAEAHPGLAELVLVGKSWEGREIWALEVTNKKTGPASSKPAMYIDGNIHGNEVQSGETVLYTAWYLLEQYGRVDRVTQLLDARAFYLLPSINPDGRDHWFDDPNNPHTNRGGRIPLDNDRDGLLDEDGPDDLDGDGQITAMRVKDRWGRLVPDPKYPEFLMVEAEPDQPGVYRLIQDSEGIDNDGDGDINEDGPGGYDPNRNWAWDWQPQGIQSGAHDYPFSLPETRAVADYVLARPNIAGAQSYHNAGGMILRGPGRDGAPYRPDDDAVFRMIATRGEQMLPGYRSLVTFKDLYTVWGGELDWFYGGLGILTFTNELWTTDNLYRRPLAPGDEGDRERQRFVERLLLNEGLTPWRTVQHPTLGEVEVGGMAKTFGRVPPSFMLEDELHRNAMFTVYHAQQMPSIRFGDLAIEAMGGGVTRIRVGVENTGTIPTRLGQDVQFGISPDNTVTLEGEGLRVLAGGIVSDPDHRLVNWQKVRPHRVRIDTIRGLSQRQVEFLVQGSGRAVIRAEATRGGTVETSVSIGP